METGELIRKMSARVAQCRSLARTTADERTARILDQMADEGEADIERLLAEKEGRRLANAEALSGGLTDP